MWGIREWWELGEPGEFTSHLKGELLLCSSPLQFKNVSLVVLELLIYVFIQEKLKICTFILNFPIFEILLSSHSSLRLPIWVLDFKLVSFFVCFGNSWERIKFTFWVRLDISVIICKMTLDFTQFSLCPLYEG